MLGIVVDRENINRIFRPKRMQITIPIKYSLIAVTYNISPEESQAHESKGRTREGEVEELTISQVPCTVWINWRIHKFVFY